MIAYPYPWLSKAQEIQKQIDVLKAEQTAILDAEMLKLNQETMSDETLKLWIENLPDGLWKKQMSNKLKGRFLLELFNAYEFDKGHC